MGPFSDLWKLRRADGGSANAQRRERHAALRQCGQGGARGTCAGCPDGCQKGRRGFRPGRLCQALHLLLEDFGLGREIALLSVLVRDMDRTPQPLVRRQRGRRLGLRRCLGAREHHTSSLACLIRPMARELRHRARFPHRGRHMPLVQPLVGAEQPAPGRLQHRRGAVVRDHSLRRVVVRTVRILCERREARELVAEGREAVPARIRTAQRNVPVDGGVAVQDVVPHGGDVAAVAGRIVALHVALAEVGHVRVGGPVHVLRLVTEGLMPLELLLRGTGDHLCSGLWRPS
mmetsp:Transcript_4114/g.10596  ORF Transcript_4114/g.10596 Transcript_4114/m.10596 type:complete len:289 (+) Transcript_4114:184-1050(+)